MLPYSRIDGAAVKSSPFAPGPAKRASTTAWPSSTAISTPSEAAPSVIATPRGVRRPPRKTRSAVSNPPTTDTAVNEAVARKTLSSWPCRSSASPESVTNPRTPGTVRPQTRAADAPSTAPMTAGTTANDVERAGGFVFIASSLTAGPVNAPQRSRLFESSSPCREHRAVHPCGLTWTIILRAQ